MSMNIVLRRISMGARKLASFDIPTRDNIPRYQWNNDSIPQVATQMRLCQSVLHSVPWPMDTTSYQTKVDIFNLEFIEN